ncbi:hypothetical protein QEN19_000680 [Hanseniaspora menglaensis]
MAEWSKAADLRSVGQSPRDTSMVYVKILRSSGISDTDTATIINTGPINQYTPSLDSSDAGINQDIGLLDSFVFLAILTGIVLMAVLSLIVIYCIVRDVTAKFLGLFMILSDEDENEDIYGANGSGQRNNNSRSANPSGEQYDLTKYLDVSFFSIESIEESLGQLPLDEQFFYKQGEDYLKMNPPYIINGLSDSHLDPIITEQALQYIEEEGAKAWEFVQTCNKAIYPSSSNNVSLLNESLVITDKTDLQFLNGGYEVSTWTNLPIPYKKRVYYYECKVLEINNDAACTELDSLSKEIISIGLTTLPYPDFRLPGRHHHSVSYDSNGDRRLNTSFLLPSELVGTLPTYKKSDIIGVGYRCKSGTVFFTRNGKKIKEFEIGHIRKWRPKYLYPCIGSNLPCKLNVNFGTRGFVYIEANSKKWGYGSINGMKLPPPAYDKARDDFILEEGLSDEDDEDLSDEEWDEEESVRFLNFNNNKLIRTASKKRKKSFLSRSMNLLPPAPFFDFENKKNEDSVNLINSNLNSDQISMKFMPPTVPPEYSSE